jgi:hypothetical protein
MFQTHSHRRSVVAVAIATLACLIATPSLRAQEPEKHTVALLFSAFEPEAWEDPVCIVKGPGPQNQDPVSTASHEGFGEFGGRILNPIRALYVTRGGPGHAAVYMFDTDIWTESKVMLLGPQSDAEVLGEFWVSRSGNTLTPTNEYSADFFLVIVRATVRGN